MWLEIVFFFNFTYTPSLKYIYKRHQYAFITEETFLQHGNYKAFTNNATHSIDVVATIPASHCTGQTEHSSRASIKLK